MSRHINEVIALRRLNKTVEDGLDCEFESVNKLKSLGRDGSSLAFGGCAIALALHAAYQTLSQEQLKTAFAHSILGHYLAPMMAGECLKLSVSSSRDTRSFASRLVKAFQERKGKAPTPCFIALVDFHVFPRQAPLLIYTLPAPEQYLHHSKLDDYTDTLDSMVRDGNLSPQARDKYQERNTDFLSLFQSKISPGGFNHGTAGGVVVKQLAPEITAALSKQGVWERASSEWIRLRRVTEDVADKQPDRLSSKSSNLTSACSLAYVLDMLVFWSLMHSFKDFDDVSAAASLDFALRFHCDDVDATRWLLRESRVPVAADERTYNETRCWQERSDGSMHLVATMNQVALFRRAQLKL